MDTPVMPTPTPTPNPSGSGSSSKKILLIILAVVVGLGLLSLIGGFIAAKAVGFGLKKAIEAGGVKIDENGGTFTFTGGDGQQVEVSDDGQLVFTDEDGQQATISSGEKLPDDFPSDFPVAGGLAVESAAVADTPEGKLFTVSWRNGDLAAVRAFYERELPARGWKIEQRVETGDSLILYFAKPAAAADEQDGGWLGVDGDEVTLWLVYKK